MESDSDFEVTDESVYSQELPERKMDMVDDLAADAKAEKKSKARGHKDTGPSVRGWQFTDFGMTSSEKDWQTDDITFVCWGVEVCPNTGRQHRQGLVWFKQNARRTKVQKRAGNKCHCEPIKKPKALEIYNQKDGVVFKWGEPVAAGHRTDISAAYKFAKDSDGDIKKAADQAPVEYMKYHGAMGKVANMHTQPPPFRKLDVTILWGQAGTGKTSWPMYKYGRENVAIYTQTAHESKFFDTYYRQDVLLIEFDNGPFMKHQEILQFLDGHPQWINVKHGGCYARWTKVVITSNNDPEGWYSHVWDAHPESRKAFNRRITRVAYIDKPMQHLVEFRAKQGSYLVTRLL